MSTRSIGYRNAVGTGGANDFLHRDRIQAIVVSKRRLRYTIAFHFFLSLVMALRLSVALCVLAGVRPPRPLQRLNFPRADPWEFAWLAGALIASLIGHLGITRNRILLVRIFIAATAILILGPVGFGIWEVYAPLRAYWETREVGARDKFMNAPVVVLRAAFLVVAAQAHLYGMAFARGLLGAWRARLDALKRAS